MHHHQNKTFQLIKIPKYVLYIEKEECLKMKNLLYFEYKSEELFWALVNYSN
jgi:hypothetical protein